MEFESVVSLVMAAVLGVFYHAVITEIWGYYAASEFSVFGWLLETVGGGAVLFYLGLFTHDIIVNLLLAAPFAAVFVVFRGLNYWHNVFLAVLASGVVGYAGVDWSYFARAAQRPITWMAWAMQLCSLPLASVAIRTIRSRVGGNQFPSKARSCNRNAVVQWLSIVDAWCGQDHVQRRA